MAKAGEVSPEKANRLSFSGEWSNACAVKQYLAAGNTSSTDRWYYRAGTVEQFLTLPGTLWSGGDVILKGSGRLVVDKP